MPPERYRQALRAGARLLWYEIVSVLGQGGFGITYFARDTNLDQPVAIKEYLPVDIARRGEEGAVEPRAADDAELYEQGKSRFLAESRTLSRFDHPNIVRVYSVFEANNTAYMVMRYEDGESLNDILVREGTLEQVQILAIAKPLLHGLAQIHSAGYIHRDVQPGNIYLRRDGSPVLIDFGAARENSGKPRTMTILVAPGYAPIEQYYAHGQEQGPWTDIYGLGATLYRAIAGVAPIDAIERSRGILGSTRDVLVPAIVAGHGRYSESLLRAIDHALMFNERDRPQSATEWATELDAVRHAPELIAASVANRSASTPPTMAHVEVMQRSEPPRTNRVAMLSAVLAAAILGAALLAGWTYLQFKFRWSPASRSPEHVLPGEDETGVAVSPDIPSSIAPAEIVSRGPSTPSKDFPPSTSIAVPEETKAAAGAARISEGEPTIHDVLTVSDDELPLTLAPSLASLSSSETTNESTARDRSVPTPEFAEEVGQALAERIAAESARIAGLESKLKDLEQKRVETERRLRDISTTEPSLEANAPEASHKSPVDSATSIVPAEPVEPAPTEPSDAQNEAQTPSSAVKSIADQAQSLIARGEYQAARELLESTTSSDARAEFLLANLLRDGKGGLTDQDAALEHYFHAAQLGFLDAQVALARTYAPRAGNRYQEPFLAYTWFVVAEQNGAFDIANERDQISRLLQPEQLPQALALALALRASTANSLSAAELPGASAPLNSPVAKPQ